MGDEFYPCDPHNTANLAELEVIGERNERLERVKRRVDVLHALALVHVGDLAAGIAIGLGCLGGHADLWIGRERGDELVRAVCGMGRPRWALAMKSAI